MKNAKWVRSLALLLLFLTFHIAPPNNSFVTKAQDQPAPPQLEGIRFKGMPMSVPPNFSKLNTYYIFEKQGRVICRRVITTPAEYKTEYQFGNPKEVYYPGSINSSDEMGTYKQTGNVVRLEFSDRYMDATIKPAGLEGVVTFKESNKSEYWVVAKPLGTVANSASSSETPGPNQPITIADRKRAVQSYIDGQSLYDRRKYTEAIGKFDETIAVLPTFYDAYLDRGEAKTRLRDYQEAIRDFDKVIQVLRNNNANKALLEAAYEWRGNAKLELEDYKGALVDYNLFFSVI